MIYTLIDGGKNTISFDCVTSANINRTATVTSHPTETGSPISDHVFFSNLTIGISGVVTDFNFYNPNSRTAGGSVYFDSDGNIKAATTAPKTSAFEVLLALFDNRDIVEVVASDVPNNAIDSYPNCVIKSLTRDDKPENGGSITFNVELEQIRLVSPLKTQVTTKPTELQTQQEIKAVADAQAKATEQAVETPVTPEKTPMQLAIEATNAQTSENLMKQRAVEAQIAELQKQNP